MPDDTITPESATDSRRALPVEIGALEIEGIRPQVGDAVVVKVKGAVTKIVDQIAWVNPETVNGAPIPNETPDASEDELLKSAMAHDMATTY